MKKIIIGIDPGVKTGIAAKRDGCIQWAGTAPIWDLFNHLDRGKDFVFVVEDARKRSGGFKSAQGAGWVKTLCGQIEAYLKSKGCEYKMVAPIRNGTKLNRKQVAKITGYDEITNEHERDAIMLAWNN